MIPVKQQPEPDDFDRNVRQPGQRWLEGLGVGPGDTLSKGKKFAGHEYWSKSQKDLWEKYQGVCAYLCIYFELSLGANSTDHFIPKSQDAWLAYEWSNYRLSCLRLNRDKGTKTILDPFKIKKGTFYLEFTTFEIFPNPALTSSEKTQVLNTIAILKLNSPIHKSMRQKRYLAYKKNDVSKTHLKHESPLIYEEAKRQGLL